MNTLRITVVAEEFALGRPAPHLLDRFLLGYPRDGEFHQLENCEVQVHVTSTGLNPELDRRQREHGLVITTNLAAALEGANAVLIVPHASATAAADELVLSVLRSAPPGCSCFVHGTLAGSRPGLKRILEVMDTRELRLGAGTSVAVTWRLPDIDLPAHSPLKEGLIVVQGRWPSAELDGLEGLLPVLERRAGGEAGVKSVRFLEEDALWTQGDAGTWSWQLLAAAISRSDSPQGDPVTDGRTQDLIGLGLVKKLARQPRAWILEHRDGLHSAILVLDGVVADYNFAVQATDGRTFSAQLFRPPKPAQHQFSRLAAVLEDFFRGGALPWSLERSFLTAELMETFAQKH